MLDKKVIKTLYLIPEVDPQKAQNRPFAAEPEIHPDESKFGNEATARVAFRAVQIASQLAFGAIEGGRHF